MRYALAARCDGGLCLWGGVRCGAMSACGAGAGYGGDERCARYVVAVARGRLAWRGALGLLPLPAGLLWLWLWLWL